MGMLIGKGGAGLRDMQEKSRVKVRFRFSTRPRRSTCRLGVPSVSFLSFDSRSV